MAELSNPMREDVDSDVKKLFTHMDYGNFNGVRREVNFIGGETRVEHGLGFTPDLAQLTVRVHLALADIGQIYVTRADERSIYVGAPRKGKAYLEISHPPRGK